MRTSGNFKAEVNHEVKAKITLSDIMCWKVEDKGELRTFENVSPKIKMRTYENVSPKRLLDSSPFKNNPNLQDEMNELDTYIIVYIFFFWCV